jgi:hypothetical protein
MSTWKLAQMRSWTTKDPRIRVADFGHQNWRTVVTDEPGSNAWEVTGPPYPTKRAAYAALDDVLADYFGELPTRAQLEEVITDLNTQLAGAAAAIEQAQAIAREAGSYHKVERMTEALTWKPGGEHA